MGLFAVHILAVEREGVAYAGFSLGCDWAEGLGIGVLTHQDRVLQAGPWDVAFDFMLARRDGGDYVS
jgi:hypothetical protein